MKARRSFLALIIFMFSFALMVQTANAAPSSITIGFIPGENPETLRENGEEIAKLLQAKIGIPVKIVVSKDYNALIEQMKEKKIDFAFFTATTYVFAEKIAGAKVLLKKVWEGPYYYSTLLVRGDSPIKKVQQLKGKSIAFVDQKSGSGYLYPQHYLKKQKIDSEKFFSKVVYSGNHEASVKMLKEGQVDAIAVFSNDPKAADTAWSQFAPKMEGKTKSARAIWISDPIANDPFVVRQDFYDSNPKISHDLMFALVELNDDAKDGARFKKLLGVSSLMLATSQQYEPVREMIKALDLKLQ